jgi:DNA-binding transcriptional ArsR family regulator
LAVYQPANSSPDPDRSDRVVGGEVVEQDGGVLAQLSAGQTISVTELARRMGVSLSTASELVGDLARAGLIERREDPTNRRRTLTGLADPTGPPSNPLNEL